MDDAWYTTEGLAEIMVMSAITFRVLEVKRVRLIISVAIE
jgi:hypothetical protein